MSEIISKESFTSVIKKEIRENILISVPLISSQLIYASSAFIGTAMVAQLGEDALAASVLVSTIWMSLSVLFFGILNSVSVLVSHAYGAKNDRAISEIMGQSVLLGAMICIVMVAVLMTMPLFLHWSDQPEHVLKLAREYMFSLLWTVPALVLLIIYEQFLAGINRTKIVLRISLLVVPIEIPLIYVLIFGKFGLPECGVAGVGYGFATTYSLTAIGLIIYLFKSKYYQRFELFKRLTSINSSYFKELIYIGFPTGLTYVIEVSTFAIMTFWIAQFGTTFLAAHQIIMQYLNFVITLAFAMGQAVTVRVGHCIGGKNYASVRTAIYVGMLLSFFFVVLISFSFYFFPEFYLQLDLNLHDSKNLLLIRDSTMLLAICSVLLLFDNFRIIGIGALRGLKDNKFPMYSSFISFWIIGLIVAYLAAFKLSLEGKGIWWGLVFGIACGAVMVFMRLQKLLSQLNNR